MTVQTLHIFITGATGYIGGTILTCLLKHPKSDSFKITAIVRNPEKAKQLKSLGVKVEIGSHSDPEKVEALAAEADVVFEAADVDDLGGTQAVLKGLKKRHEKTGQVPVLIHTSGTAVLCDNASGLHDSSTVYSDASVEQIESLAPSQPHREVDLAVVGADQQGYLRSYIVLPALIWGLATGPLVDIGVQNPHSQQIPLTIRSGLKRGKAVIVGEGKNFWPNVNIEELGDLYMIIFNKALNDAQRLPHGREGFYFGASDEHRFADIYKTVAKALYEAGKVSSPDPAPLEKDEVEKYFGTELMATTVMGGNSRCRADRSLSIGWTPKKGTKEMLASIKPEVETILKESQ